MNLNVLLRFCKKKDYKISKAKSVKHSTISFYSKSIKDPQAENARQQNVSKNFNYHRM